MLHILKLDSLGDTAAAEGRDYEHLYAKLLENGGFKNEIAHYEVRYGNQYPSNVREGDTVLLGGSRLDAFANDDFTLKLLDFVKKMVADPLVKLIGVCYGHQIIARALGGEVARAEAWECGIKPIELTRAGKEVFGELKSNDGLVEMHLDAVSQLPNNAVVLARSAQCAVQAFSWKKNVLCVQGHPEFSVQELTDCLHRLELRDPVAARGGMECINRPHRGPDYGFALARFANQDL